MSRGFIVPIVSLFQTRLFAAPTDRWAFHKEKVIYLPDGVTGPQTNPLGDGTVLLLGFGKLLLGAETLVALMG